MLCCESGLLEVSLLWLREILHSQSPDMGAVAIFFLPQMLIDIRIPNHAMIKKNSVMVAVCWENNNLTPGYIGVKLHLNIT